MISKTIVENLINRYKRKIVVADRATETSDDLVYAFHQIFDELVVELRIKSDLLPFEKFLQYSLNNAVVFKQSENSFEVVVNYGDLIDEAKTTAFTIDDFHFIVKTAISSQTSITEKDLRDAIEAYRKVKES